MQLEKEKLEYFRELETKLHRKDIRNSPDVVLELLADEFMEFGSSGLIYNKSETVESLKNEQKDLQIIIENFMAQSIGSDIVLVTYRSSKLDPDDGTRFSALRSSIWKLIDGKWRMIFHQGTRIKI